MGKCLKSRSGAFWTVLQFVKSVYLFYTQQYTHHLKWCVFWCVCGGKIHTVSLDEKMRYSAFVAEYLKIIPCYRVVFVQLLLKITVEKSFECLTVSCFVTETLKNTAKTGIFNRLAQNQHKNIKIYAVDFSS